MYLYGLYMYCSFGMLLILLALQIFSYCRVIFGSRFADVKRINLLLIVSVCAGIASIMVLWYDYMTSYKSYYQDVLLYVAYYIFVTIRVSTFTIAYWMFSLKYLKSSLQMPALFGGKPVSERTNKFLKVMNVVIVVLGIVLPILLSTTACWGLFNCHYFGNGYYDCSTEYKVAYTSFASMEAFQQLFIASVLIYAVVSFRMIIKKYGLLKRINYRMFIINAVAMGLYALSVFVYFFQNARWGYYSYEEQKTQIKVNLVCNIVAFCS